MFWLRCISLASFFPEKYDFMQCTYVNSSWNSFSVEGTHGFYSTSILFHIIGYNWFQFKRIHLGLDKILFECTPKFFSLSVVWGEIREYITNNLFSYCTRSLELLISNDTIGFQVVLLLQRPKANPHGSLLHSRE